MTRINDPTYQESIEKKIFVIRKVKVLLAGDLAKLYGVPVGRLNEAVKRNRSRFPSDFMFQLSAEEYENLRYPGKALNLISQFAISSLKWGGRRHAPYVFTQEGVAMLSSILRSKRAIEVNIAIMRAFVKLRKGFLIHKEFAQKLTDLEKKYQKHDVEINEIFKAIRALMSVPDKPKRRIGFHAD